MSSLFEQATANSVEKPAPAKHNSAVPPKGSGMDVKSSTLSMDKPQGGQMTEACQHAKAVQMPTPEAAQTPTPGMKKVQSGIEYFQP
ncbi:hypothetical protein Hte_002231 [Hypoxylon texense]